MQWVNLYGCNATVSNKQAQIQNEDLELSTTFKGRVLVEYSCLDMETPEFKIQDIDETDEEYQGRLSKMVVKDYQIVAEIGSAVCLPESKDY